jgi:V8-like Glu-specific endopeptidase
MLSHQEPLDPFSAIIPILRLDANGLVKGVAGTGFFVGTRPLVVTAKHVFLGDPLAEGEQFGMAVFRPDGTTGIGTIKNYLVCDKWDIAVFAAGGHPRAIPLSLSRGEHPVNHDVLAFEYSSTTIETDEAGQRTVKFQPFTHKGNILRHYVSTFPVKIPTRSFDVSFPALQGASGAPVLRTSDWGVVGMLVANVERHLMPAQVVRIDLDGTGHEEVAYFLPTGQAIEARLIAEYLDEVGGDATVVD